MAKNKKEFKPITFSIKGGDFEGVYQIKREKLHIPALKGKVTAKQLVDDMPEVLEELVKINSGAIVQVKDGGKKKDDVDPDLEAARKEYEELTGNKPGTRKLETLQKEIEEAKKAK